MSVPATAMPLPAGGQYRVIYADPPWAFETWSHRGQGKGASQHYPTQHMDWLKSLPVSDLAGPNAALFLWVVQPLFPQALELIRAWGFEYKTVGYVWVKCKQPAGQMLFWDEAFAEGLARKGLGYHTRSGSEQCWIATRGKGYARLSKGEAQVVHAPLREHSRKPDEIADSICRLAEGPRVELFARTTRPGFDAWGNEIDKFDPAVTELVQQTAVSTASACAKGNCEVLDSIPAAPVFEPPTSGPSDDDLLEIPYFLRRDLATGRLLSELAPAGRVFP
jgi:N6-adenosine-specific RNA methylase IME4